ncbi:16S rRNA (cytosine(1402)-N(4))-methyltransferase RsmH [Xanthomonas sacchari]|uniref:Ribosomal RNA small subunit methyltransferase H n=1 Tax=Xanthomonas sacchari TaxID=56458 RepID=A0A2P5YYH4_9XANT|nr:16S rRNA (cytosine(1402)-N(4))-methyltransferase RsmH [Xanthomonas sacchari]MDV0439860.1 16S rRNA (cytosine(1402)-N(4))-methyltransferase RsmH [Xanthomonas sacchari]PPU79720.1 16S rRNA (cytosine(1402)-N(4))-methyltransferase RsmH [Xanthomonas sacchari]
MRGQAQAGHLPVSQPSAAHVPVLFAQVLDGLQVIENGIYLDGTFGRGGHARGVLHKLGPGGRLLVMDKDPEAIAEAEHAFGADARVSIYRGSFAELGQWDAATALDGVLFDLGVSSPQLDVAARGFSFGKDGPLDMRMDPDAGESAAQWLARAEEREIADVLWTYGEERQSRRIARAIVARREKQPLTRTAELADLIASVMPRGDSKTHPATRSFQAIRIHINRELADLETGLDAALARLKPGGRLAVISFHSLEDRIVKQFMQRHAKAPPSNRRLPEATTFVPTLRLHGGAIKADADELAANPRARSAVLRVAEKLGIGSRESGIGKGESKSALPGTEGFRAQSAGSSPFPIPVSPFPPAHGALHRSAP